jgi:AcrR family transcriptional regulator
MVSANAQGRLILTAERLIAERGVDVPLREIAAEAGQRNNSAVHYHFGSRDALIEAVIENRQAALEAARLALLADHEASGRADDVSILLEILIGPMLRIPYEQDATHYARFLEQVRNHPSVKRPLLDRQHWPAANVIITRLDRALHDIPQSVRRRRLHAMATVMFALLADEERAGRVEDGAAITEIIDMLAGMLTAPARSPRGLLASTH